MRTHGDEYWLCYTNRSIVLSLWFSMRRVPLSNIELTSNLSDMHRISIRFQVLNDDKKS